MTARTCWVPHTQKHTATCFFRCKRVVCYIRYLLLLSEESHSTDSTCRDSNPHFEKKTKNNFFNCFSQVSVCCALYYMIWPQWFPFQSYITYLEATVLVSSTMVPYCSLDKQTYLCVQMKTNIDEIKLAREYWIYELNVWIRLGFLYWIKDEGS